ncbi:LacI family DNA-binding transcriptional regulator (plasmid) [Rhizobium leguminosarum]|uniref:LacI family DNA-binding transcriptional regulator n=1 Tax=Rhizobium leguminosarum TaxID=384 RepID=UPI001441E9C4|nr:LacI family DNA-binding transcriptional regulator [Rhizobium leguminosarum]MBY5818550.1 LacI family transcriptional regulator [Rhizobium leguminosarum]MBY5838480.1 LacI family transcriptional regulator [Rhizobium leguminosarum]NKM77328.1 LacI family DNA-binding transcriptional regulator [Rhizobium leguminosarum bv. viciae]QSZ12449.1 LacI family DNA-binding transcriptional regulator [Rhizobium leguminosarum]
MNEHGKQARPLQPASNERNVTVADVARHASVSTAAVSFYFSDRAEHLKRVGPEARERIRAAVEALGYVPNKTARHLRRQKSERLCIILPKLGIPYADKMVQDLGQAAVERGLLPIVSTASNIAELQKVLAEVEAGLADGVVADVEYLSEEQVDAVFAGMGKDCLIIHPTARSMRFSVLNNGLVAALETAFEDLISKGHRIFAYVQNTGLSPNHRLQAIMDRRRRLNGDVVIDTMVGAGERSLAADCAHKIVALEPRPTAVFVESDYTAVTVIEEFSRLGISVPREIAVVGCGNAEEGFYCEPRLTTIGPEWGSLEEAGRYLIDSIATSERQPPRAFHTSWTYILRASA